MADRFAHLKRELESWRRDSLYRKMNAGRVSGAHILIGGKELLNMCSNDYLGMPGGIRGDNSMMQSSSRLVAGDDPAYSRLEKQLARHKSMQSALVFPTGYMANIGTLGALVQKGDTVLSDELNHASIIEGIKLSGARRVIYRHNDAGDLEARSRGCRGRIFIVTEGVFSMDGDIAPLAEITEVAEKRGAITVLDDAHGDFVMGKDGRGTPRFKRVQKKIDVYISSLSKGLGSFGGYVAASGTVTEYLINKSRPFVYTSALPSQIVEHARLRLCAGREKYRKRLWKNVEYFAELLSEYGLDAESDSQIIPVRVGAASTALAMGKSLRRSGVFVQPIRYPTVPEDTSRLRLSITARHTKSHLMDAATALRDAAKRHGVL